jgi:hypothetical protein
MSQQQFHEDFKKMSTAASAAPSCVQDQYGNQYSFTVDAAHGYITGHATNHQGCAGGTWPLLGSFEQVAGGTMVEFTLRNPSPASGCVPAYKLKGLWPKSAWYYESGFGGQEFTFTACGGHAVAAQHAQTEGKGTRK